MFSVRIAQYRFRKLGIYDIELVYILDDAHAAPAFTETLKVWGINALRELNKESRRSYRT